MRSNALLSGRHAVGNQALCMVLLQDYEHIRCRGRRCCRVAIRRYKRGIVLSKTLR